MTWTGIAAPLAGRGEIVASPARDAAWWEVGAMPLLLMAVGIIIALLAVATAKRLLASVSAAGRQ